jgi:hypothetical protein
MLQQQQKQSGGHPVRIPERIWAIVEQMAREEYIRPQELIRSLVEHGLAARQRKPAER